jgi:hypothetical protein
MKAQLKTALMILIIATPISLINNGFKVRNNRSIGHKVNKPIRIRIDRASTYNAVVSQCDSDPLNTADMSRIDTVKLKLGEIRWCALSRDLLSRWGGIIDYGDTITVKSIRKPQINGEWVVHDCMNARYKNSVDFLFDPSNNVPKLGVCMDLIVEL